MLREEMWSTKLAPLPRRIKEVIEAGRGTTLMLRTRSHNRVPVLPRMPIIALLSTPVVPQDLPQDHLLVRRRTKGAISVSRKDITGMTAQVG